MDAVLTNHTPPAVRLATLVLCPYTRVVVLNARSIASVADLDVPVIYFVNDGPHLLADAATSGAHMLGLCWRTPLDEAAACEGPDVAPHGNLNPHALFVDPADVARLALDVLAHVVGHAASIMNPGHGILPDTLIACEHALVEAVDQTAGRDAASAPHVCTT